jgi:hypothetical protein
LKKAENYPFGEDVMGNLEMNRDFKSDRSPTHKFSGGSIFSLECINKELTTLDSYLKTAKQEKQKLISENKQKSIMDESNILE